MSDGAPVSDETDVAPSVGAALRPVGAADEPDDADEPLDADDADDAVLDGAEALLAVLWPMDPRASLRLADDAGSLAELVAMVQECGYPSDGYTGMSDKLVVMQRVREASVWCRRDDNGTSLAVQCKSNSLKIPKPVGE